MRISLRRLRVVAIIFSISAFILTALQYFDGVDKFNIIDKLKDRCEAHLLNDTVNELIKIMLTKGTTKGKGLACNAYKNGSTFGSLCFPICMNNSFKFNGCIHHHTTIVLLATYNSKEVVLKRKLPTARRSDTLSYHQSRYEEAKDWNAKKSILKECLSDLMVYKIGMKMKALPDINIRIENILAQYLPFVNEKSAAGLFKIWENFEDDEYSFYSFYNDFEYFPKLIGTCGMMYGVEQAKSLSHFIPNIGKSSAPWKQRFVLALSLLNFIKDMESTPLGPLHHCDMQVNNFGVANGIDVSAIDVDMIFTQERIDEILPQPNCTSHEQCDFFDCLSTCDVKSGKCTIEKRSSNFQVLCQRVLTTPMFGYGLIGDALSKVNPKLGKLLSICSSKEFGHLPFNHNNVQTVFNSMKSIIMNEI